MKSKQIFPITITVLLIAFIGITLFKNKKEIDYKAQLSLQQNTVMPVRIITPVMSDAALNIIATGKIVPEKTVTITSKTQGVVLKKYRNTGDRVEKGAVIAKVEDQLVISALRTAESDYAKSKKDAERYLSLQKAGAVTQSELEAVQLALANSERMVFDLKDQLNNTTIKATASGVLEQVFIEEGALLVPGSPVAEIIDPTGLKMEVTVTEKEVVQLKPGMKVFIVSDVFAGKTFEGTVKTIGTQANDALSYKVEISIPKTDRLKPGMFATAQFATADRTERMMIDRQCIAGGLKNPYVYVVENEKAIRRPIVVGNVFDKQVEIISGLSSGDRVVSEGQINLRDGVSVNIIKN